MNRPDDEIFSDALELPPADRAAFLERACANDDAQRARIEALLAGDAAAAARADFLDAPAVARPESPEEKLGDQIGAYTLLRRIGEGGCGVVYLAAQTEPIRRQVALKVIKLGMDTRDVIARFEAERQALALMDHPGIARVFDAGATANGRPFFVMEFVDGLPITRFCDEHRLTTEQRLDLFSRVCLAIQHAHQKGIIHRDVKPSNILVTMHDEVPTPKVIDFGIAKATQGRLAQQTLVTQLDQLVGTPAYMSPEQVELRDGDVDTRSDVYSLGVLLYELLAGRPPYDPQSLVQAGVAEIRRIIREVDPPRPSTRLATLAAADRDTVARLRGAAPVQLTSVLRGDLDWIVMRCLEKDRARRYGTASELAEDVRRHLRRETVAARPPDLIYRTRKFVSRHRLACASAAAIALSLIAGTVVSLVQAGRARRAETTARAERDAAQSAQRAEALARADAQRRQEQAEALLSFMLGDFRTELKKIGKLSLLDAVGDKAMAHFAALDPKDLTDTALTQQAKALTQIGEIRLDQARYADAEAAFQAACRRAAALVTRHPDNGDMLFERAQAEFWIGFTAWRRGDPILARQWLVEYRDSAAALVKLEGPTYRAMMEVVAGNHNLAVLDLKEGALTVAKKGFADEIRAFADLRRTRPDDTSLAARAAEAESWLGQVEESDGDFPAALARYTRMIDILDDLARREPKVANWKARSAEGRALIGRVLSLHHRTAEGVSRYDEAIATWAELEKLDPQNQFWRERHLSAQLNRAVLDSPDRLGAERLAAIANEIEALYREKPSSRRLAELRSSASRWIARLELEQASAEARKSLQYALDTTPVGSADQADADALSDAAQTQLLAGRVMQKLGDSVRAKNDWKNVAELLRSRAASRDWRILDPLAQALVLSDDVESARPIIERLRSFGYRPLDPLAAKTLGLSQ